MSRAEPIDRPATRLRAWMGDGWHTVEALEDAEPRWQDCLRHLGATCRVDCKRVLSVRSYRVREKGTLDV